MAVCVWEVGVGGGGKQNGAASRRGAAVEQAQRRRRRRARGASLPASRRRSAGSMTAMRAKHSRTQALMARAKLGCSLQMSAMSVAYLCKRGWSGLGGGEFFVWGGG